MGMPGNATRLRMIAQGIVVFLIDSVITTRSLCFPFADSSDKTDLYDLFYGIISRKIKLSKTVQKPYFNIISHTFSFFHTFIKIKCENINIFAILFHLFKQKRQRFLLCLENDPYERLTEIPLPQTSEFQGRSAQIPPRDSKSRARLYWQILLRTSLR
jgi:hypothetical protein